MKFADLHLHTYFSDGTYSPEELVEAALKAGLAAISIVDHDTVDALPQAMGLGLKQGIEILPGIELTSEYNGTEIHILGYLVDSKNQELLKKLDFLKKNRSQRIYKIADKLKAIGINLRPESVFEVARDGTPGRLHVAQAMVREGIVNSVPEAFQKYIGDQGPGYVCGFRLSPAEAMSLIQKASGIPVLAHPYTLRNDELIVQFLGYGLKGLEVYYPEHSQSMVNFYLEMAKKYNLLVTGGSDCHGQAKPEVKIGSVKIPYSLVDKLKEAKSSMLDSGS